MLKVEPGLPTSEMVDLSCAWEGMQWVECRGKRYISYRGRAEIHGSEYMDIVNVLKFDSSVRLTRMNWWLSVLALGVLNVIGGIIGALTIPLIGTLVMVVCLVASIAIAVGRLRDRGHSEPLQFALRLIIVPWGFVECGFLAGTE